jgi:GNAT superfamily N-acetyltransferase
MSIDPRCGFVFNVYTDPSHRKQGLARRMMDAIHEWCRAEGIERVVLNASSFGRALYESMGYVAADEPMMRLRL